MKTQILAVGKMKDKAQLALYADYARRLTPAPVLREVSESRDLEAMIDPGAFVVVLDERGRNLSSHEFAETMQNAMNAGKSTIQALIGGADGHSDAVRARADLLLSFGKLTWPHMLARIMVAEQIYRAHQILAGHPYHREG
ncbi:MAG: 23S rRNA (pseudouridine(1915)-N(3))-methyltransferase RlmH [Alphaproteobacteria bacterium]|nr:23S rRNA (pseudouridine(1915)-N(3))-methyltransferase RlmH [Alphaproteobacteria bacterium]USO07634.1 MAG: 23S rRNA (pseudouridine(1915)-N(3))-methyltransferase RlmH [Rhodospirillales bacterium]